MRLSLTLVAALAMSSCASAADTDGTGLSTLGIYVTSCGAAGGCGQQSTASQTYGIVATSQFRVTLRERIRERVQSRPRLFAGRGCR